MWLYLQRETNLPFQKKKKKKRFVKHGITFPSHFEKHFIFRDIIFRSSIDSRRVKEFSLSSYAEETTHYELYRRVNFFSRLDRSPLSLSRARNHAWKCVKIDAGVYANDFFTEFFLLVHHGPLWGQLSADFFLSRLVGISTKLPARRPTMEHFISPYRFSTFLSFFLSLFFQDSSLSLSLFLVVPSTIETTVSKEKEINRDNIYLSPQKKERKKERNEKHRPSILTSFFLIIIFPCGIWRKISTKKKKEKMNKKEDRKDKGGKVSGNVLRGVWRGNF